jgi:hypothetical protein
MERCERQSCSSGAGRRSRRDDDILASVRGNRQRQHLAAATHPRSPGVHEDHDTMTPICHRKDIPSAAQSRSPLSTLSTGCQGPPLFKSVTELLKVRTRSQQRLGSSHRPSSTTSTVASLSPTSARHSSFEPLAPLYHLLLRTPVLFHRRSPVSPLRVSSTRTSSFPMPSAHRPFAVATTAADTPLARRCPHPHPPARCEASKVRFPLPLQCSRWPASDCHMRNGARCGGGHRS